MFQVPAQRNHTAKHASAHWTPKNHPRLPLSNQPEISINDPSQPPFANQNYGTFQNQQFAVNQPIHNMHYPMSRMRTYGGYVENTNDIENTNYSTFYLTTSINHRSAFLRNDIWFQLSGSDAINTSSTRISSQFTQSHQYGLPAQNQYIFDWRSAHPQPIGGENISTHAQENVHYQSNGAEHIRAISGNSRVSTRKS